VGCEGCEDDAFVELFDEFPAFPDFTMPLRGGISCARIKHWPGHGRKRSRRLWLHQQQLPQAKSQTHSYSQTTMADNDLYNLEFLSLIARITQEIYNYIELNDKTLAEYVVALHDQSNTLQEFKDKLNGVLPDSAVENIDRLILSLHPKHKQKSKALANNLARSHVDGDSQHETDKQKRLFPGLALPDQEGTKDVLMKEVDDMMAQFEGTAKKKFQVDGPDANLEKPQRRDRSRSRSPPRQRSRSPDRGRSYDSRRDYRNGGRDRAPLDERPILFKIYNGRVSGMKDFGAFVQLEGIAGRVEGKESCANNALSCSLHHRHGSRLEHSARRPRKFCF
jgi:ATP-dependent RNA helicase DHX8/PRP22